MWKWEVEEQPKAVAVIIHSAYEHHRWYAWLIENLMQQGFHVVMGDLPGHGEENRYMRVHNKEMTDYLLYIKKLMQSALQYQLPIFIIGHGFGATLAIQFLEKSKLACAGVILTAPWLRLKIQPNRLTNALKGLSSLTSNMKIIHPLDRNLLSTNLDSYEEIHDGFPYITTVTVGWYSELQQLMKNIISPQFISLTLPILLMTAKKDKVTDSLAARKWFLQQYSTQMQYKEWQNSHHNLFHDNERELVFRYALDFMNNVLRSIGYVVE